MNEWDVDSGDNLQGGTPLPEVQYWGLPTKGWHLRKTFGWDLKRLQKCRFLQLKPLRLSCTVITQLDHYASGSGGCAVCVWISWLSCFCVSAGVADHLVCNGQWIWSTLSGNHPPHKTLLTSPTCRHMIASQSHEMNITALVFSFLEAFVIH